MRKFLTIIISFAVVIPSFVFAAAKSPFYYAAWLPFWNTQPGAQEIALNLEKFNEVSPFSYEVKSNGTLVDKLKINEGIWPAYLAALHDLRVKIIPSVALFNGNTIHSILSNTALRRKHEDIISALVSKQNFDGIDIDYENKDAKTKDYFSLFIKGLALRLHPKGKTLSCTIEPRTPADSQFVNPPKTISYANDYNVINTYCDEVRIMAYDQGNIDLKLDAAKGGSALYMPIADPDWAEKVLKLALKSINGKKIMLGIPTYGYIYEVSWKNNVTTYKRLRSLTFGGAMGLANTLKIVPKRNNAGELSFTYGTSTPVNVSASLIYTVSSTLPNIITSIASSSNPITRFVSMSDANSIADKINLAKKYKLRGVAFFKMDGETDPKLWNKMK